MAIRSLEAASDKQPRMPQLRERPLAALPTVEPPLQAAASSNRLLHVEPAGLAGPPMTIRYSPTRTLTNGIAILNSSSTEWTEKRCFVEPTKSLRRLHIADA